MDDRSLGPSDTELELEYEYKLQLWRHKARQLEHEEQGMRLEYEKARLARNRKGKRSVRSSSQGVEQGPGEKRTKRDTQDQITVGAKTVKVVDLSESHSPAAANSWEDRDMGFEDNEGAGGVLSDGAGDEELEDGSAAEQRHHGRFDDESGEEPMEEAQQSEEEESEEDGTEEKRVDDFPGMPTPAEWNATRNRAPRNLQFKSINETFPTVCLMPNERLAELRCMECSGNTINRGGRKQALRPGASLLRHLKGAHGDKYQSSLTEYEVAYRSVVKWLGPAETAAVENEQKEGFFVEQIMVAKALTPEQAPAVDNGCCSCLRDPCEPQITSCSHIYCQQCVKILQDQAKRCGLDHPTCLKCGELFLSVTPLSDSASDKQQGSESNFHAASAEDADEEDEEDVKPIIRLILRPSSSRPLQDVDRRCD
ncbi:unnamed protein product [Zymoseptoria tritici ST99CH_1A5]|uniref:RING-type domain-containing protein n=2 Tax=Zymoseptoria tritici TaxID=1047171 RepID=A0A2H1GHU3_ZYMTR|nr:unnamed protein product [Zymoseptoria tritici ST99CH_1E4]SMY24850.1 unnamed protein product [Zymoseptoria tritici ST99CH_1A5]